MPRQRSVHKLAKFFRIAGTNLPSRQCPVVIGSEVRFVCPRNSAVPSDVGGTQVLRADPFWPEGQATPISRDGRPGHRENAFVLDCEMKLESLALIIGINAHSGVSSARKMKVLLQTPYLVFSRGFVVDQPIAFHDVESVSKRRAEPVHHG